MKAVKRLFRTIGDLLSSSRIIVLRWPRLRRTRSPNASCLNLFLKHYNSQPCLRTLQSQLYHAIVFLQAPICNYRSVLTSWGDHFGWTFRKRTSSGWKSRETNAMKMVAVSSSYRRAWRATWNKESYIDPSWPYLFPSGTRGSPFHNFA